MRVKARQWENVALMEEATLTTLLIKKDQQSFRDYDCGQGRGKDVVAIKKQMKKVWQNRNLSANIVISLAITLECHTTLKRKPTLLMTRKKVMSIFFSLLRDKRLGWLQFVVF